MGSSLNKVERTLESPSDVDGLGHDMETLDLENEPVLTLLPADDGARVMCGSVVVIQRAVERALPAGCVVAKIQQVERSGAIRVRLGFRDVAATAALRDAVVLEDGAFEQKLNAALPQWRRPATDDELVELGYAKLAGREFFELGYETLATASGREIYVRLNEADFRRPTVPVAASAHSATDEELAELGYEELTAASGRPLYVNRAANEAQLERPTVSVPASARPATDDELRGFGYETLAAASGDDDDVDRGPRAVGRGPPVETVVETVALTEVVRSTKRIVAGPRPSSSRPGARRTRGATTGVRGPALEARLFDVDGDEAARYALEIIAAIESIRRQLHGVGLDDRVAVACPDAGFAARLRAARVVVDTVDGLDGLERLIVVCAGLDRAISEDAATLETRSRLYRAMTRAARGRGGEPARPGGWLEFLGRLELTEGAGFDEERAKFDRLETAADEVVASCAGEGGDGVREVPDAAPGAALEREEDSEVVERDEEVADGGLGAAVAVDAVVQESPAAAVAPKVRCVAVFPDGRRVVSGSSDKTVKVWDAATGECVATLAGHSGLVWRGVLVLSGVIFPGF
ncbi:hypothetical protein JL722_9861 [Aureococcus anophagefferens]|nr:hypothetical protein JL722_9861 [Aureococcus anophagefferens]